MSAISIVVLHPSRWQEAKRLRLEALRQDPTAFASSYEEAQAYADEVWINRVAAAFKRDRSMTLYAENEGTLRGMAGAAWSSRCKFCHVAEVYGVYVSPAMRGQGVGTKLMSALLDELAAQPRIEKVKLSVTSSHEAAVRLYQRLGFEIVGTAKGELKVAGEYHDLYYMEKQLALHRSDAAAPASGGAQNRVQ